MSPEPHERAPESLAKEIWFYSLERRAQSTTLRRVTTLLTAVAVVLLLVSLVQLYAAAGAIAAVAAVITLEVAGYRRGERQKKSILAQLQAGENPQLVDVVGSTLPNRTVILVALAVAVVAGLVAFLIIGALSSLSN